MEREVEDDIAAGRLATFGDGEAFLADLDAQCDESAGPDLATGRAGRLPHEPLRDKRGLRMEIVY
jgi:hypothetical protein